MTKRFTLYLGCLVVTGTLLGACSRPVAYFQSEKRAHYSTPASSVVVNNTVAEQPATPVESSIAAVPVAEVSNPTVAAVNQVEAYVRNDSKLASNKQLNKRVDRLKHLLSESTAPKAVASTTTAHKMSVLERLMVKKLNKKISKHIAPDSPKKPMANGGLLGGGAVLVIGGLLLLLLTTGTGATIGVIAVIVGLVALLFGLLAS